MSSKLQKGVCALGLVCAVLGVSLIWSGVNTKVYDDHWHAPIADFFPMVALLVLVGAKGASLQTAVVTASVALEMLPSWLAAARQINKEEALSVYGVWSVYSQSKDMDEQSDSGHWSHLEPGYVLLVVAFALLAVAVAADAELDAGGRKEALTSCSSSAEKLGMAGAMALLVVFFIAGEAKLNDKAGIDNKYYGEGLSAVDLEFLVIAMLFVGLAVVAVCNRDTSASWMALLGVYGAYLWGEYLSGAAEAGGAKDATGICDMDFSYAETYCDRANNLIDGASLMVCMAGMGLGVVFLFAWFSHGGYQPAHGASRPWLLAAAVVPLCGIIAWVGVRSVEGDDFSAEAIRDLMTANAVMLELVGDMLMLSHLVGGGLRGALRAVCVGTALVTLEQASTLMGTPQIFNDGESCDQGECTIPYGPVTLYIGAQLLAVAFPFDLAQLKQAAGRGAVPLLLLVAAWATLLASPIKEFSDDAGAAYGNAISSLQLMGYLVVAGALLIAGLSEGQSRVTRSVSTFALCFAGLHALVFCETVCNEHWGRPDSDYDDDPEAGTARAKIAGSMLAVLACFSGVTALAPVGDWEHDILEGATPEGYVGV